MSITTSAHRGFPLPGATSRDRRIEDMQAVKTALTAIDADLANSELAAVQISTLGVANGVAQLDATGKVASSQLPSYVDAVLEFATLAAFPATGNVATIYVAINTNLVYRWSGTSYIEISSSPGSTDVVAEGSVNKYFTVARALAAAPVQSVAGKTGAVTLTTDDVSNCGTKNLPQNSQSLNYTTVLLDAGKHILHPSVDTTARSMTIPANSALAYDIGAAITFVNQNGAGVLTINNNDTMRLAGAGTTGARSLAANGVATALKITATEWIISGTNLT
jgi:hypothetical protein